MSICSGSQRTRIDSRHCSMDSLAGLLSGQVHRPVVNQSEIAGAYSFALEWSPNQNAEDAGASIFTALSDNSACVWNRAGCRSRS